MKKMDKKAFTLIELLVVIVVIGILVLLGAPRFTGYTQKAELTRIQHDIKVMEQEVGTVLINKDDDFNKWEDNNKDLSQLIQEGKLFEKEGVVKSEEFNIDETYKVIPEKHKDKINTKLKGTFYANSDGKVYYEHLKPLSGIPNEPEKELVYSDEEIEEIEDLIKEGYIPVATADELNNVRSATLETYGKGTKWEKEYTGGLDKKYVQVANIDLSRYSEEGWTPIGTYEWNAPSPSFTGTYDGWNYVITDLEVKGNNYQGLFGYTKGAIIHNVSLEDISVTGSGANVGGLVSRAESTNISNSYATGEVTGAKNLVGGLVGYAYDSTKISNSYATVSVTGRDSVGGLVGNIGRSTIENSYATGSVKGTSDFVGGLLGAANRGTISNTYATGSVTGDKRNVGGLLGSARNNTTIRNSYATGPVTGESRVGGLLGQSDGVTISNSYATGSVEGTGEGSETSVGGLVGWKNSISHQFVTSSYWDKESTEQATSAGEEGKKGEGKSTEEMKKQTTYSGWNFDTVWEITPGNYPTLR